MREEDDGHIMMGKIVQLQSSSMNFNRKKIKTQRQTYRKEYQSQLIYTEINPSLIRLSLYI